MTTIFSLSLIKGIYNFRFSRLVFAGNGLLGFAVCDWKIKCVGILNAPLNFYLKPDRFFFFIKTKVEVIRV